MIFTPRLRSTLAKLLIASMLALSNAVVVQTVQASILSTEQALAVAYQKQQREKVLDFVSQQQVQDYFAQQGIDAHEAQTRIAAMNDSELALLSEQIDQLPAGGDLIGTAVFVFVLLLVTDILGLTRIFPFVVPPHERKALGNR